MDNSLTDMTGADNHDHCRGKDGFHKHLHGSAAHARVAAELGRTPAQVGLAWTLRNPAVTAPVIGARTPAQLESNLGALEVDFTAAQLDRLEAASAIDLGFPHALLAGDFVRTLLHGDMKVEARR